MNICVIIGAGPFGEDSLAKMPWLSALSEKHRLHVLSRIDPAVHYSPDLIRIIGKEEFRDISDAVREIFELSCTVEIIHDSPQLKRRYSHQEISQLEGYVGISFAHLSTLDPRYSDSKKGEKTLESRIQLAAGLTVLLRDFFARNHVDFLVNTMEDDIISLVAFHVAKRLDIPVVGYVSSRFPKRGVMFALDYSNVCAWNHDFSVRFDEIRSLYSPSTIVERLDPRRGARESVADVLADKAKAIITLLRYDCYARRIAHFLPLEPIIFVDFLGVNLPSALRSYLIGRVRRKLTRLLTKKPGRGESYFLFPLHYAVDAQMTFREPLTDQYAVIDCISDSLPAFHVLYVKPHPHYQGTDTDSRRLSDLSRRGNIKVINPNLPPRDLIQGAKGVITINSTTGFEALIQGTPVISLGHDFYCRSNLCDLVRDINDLPKAIMNASNGQMNIQKENIAHFVETVYSNTVWTEGRQYDYGFVGLTKDDGRRIGHALNQVIDQFNDGHE